MVLDGKFSQEYLVNAGVLHGSILGPTTFLLFLFLELASELESDLQDTVDWGRKWLLDFNAGKTTAFL